MQRTSAAARPARPPPIWPCQLTPALTDICQTFLRLSGCAGRPVIEWDNINLQDEEALARSRLYNAQAEKLENENRAN